VTAGAGPFSRSALIWLVGISAASLVLSLFVVGFGDDLSPARTLGADSYSKSAIGSHGLTRFLEKLGIDVRVTRDPWTEYLDAETPLIVMAPVPGASAGGYDLDEVYDVAWTNGAPLVIVLPKWIPVPDEHGKTLFRVVPMARETIADILLPMYEGVENKAKGSVRRLDGENSRACTAENGTEFTADVRDLQLVVPPYLFDVVVECEGLALIAHRPAMGELGEVWIVSDPDLLNNHGLRRGDHAAMAHDLFVGRMRASGVVFDETVHGYGTASSLAAELVRFPLVMAVMHGLILSGIVAWSGGARFGRARQRPPRFGDGKLVLIENVAQLLCLGGHSRESLRAYYEQTVRSIGAHYFFAPDLPLEQLEERLQRVSRAKGLDTDLGELRARAQSGAGGTRSLDSAVRVAMQLHRWRREMTDGG
jgi:hypothetical protein